MDSKPTAVGLHFTLLNFWMVTVQRRSVHFSYVTVIVVVLNNTATYNMTSCVSMDGDFTTKLATCNLRYIYLNACFAIP